MKKMFFGALAGCLMLAASVAPASAETYHLDDPAVINHGVINLEHQEAIQGKVVELRNGQVMLQMADGSIAEIPHMAIFWGTEPREPLASVAVGQDVMVFLPEDYTMRVVSRDGGQFLLGSYEGVYRLPQQMVVSWDLDNDDIVAEH